MIDAAYRRATALLPAGWEINVVQWGDNTGGPGVDHPWYVSAADLNGDPLIGSGLDPAAALDDLTRKLAMRMSQEHGN